ncbi:hypothetical protein HYC85_023142 [Camellia sinensis]|uniref:BURP domain-containing protein n=1 Tax=Camellia sinensis TaxID=4442 RepID=A0A7J7GDQ2_CAMSI|nr:hypothetical protein HYC85_023142 [Camellia sinensis]
MTLHFTETTTSTTFLPRQVAEKIPFSSEKMQQIPNYFSVKPNSMEAKTIEHTIKECEGPGIKGEEKYCATSLESMVDFCRIRLGKSIQAISTEVKKETPLQTYTIEGVKKMASNFGYTVKPNSTIVLTDCNSLNDDDRSPKFDGHVATPCFLKSLSGLPSSQPNVNLEVFLGPVQLDNPNHSRTQPIHGFNEVGLVRSIEPISSRLQSSHVHNEVGLVRSGEVVNFGLQASHVHPPILQSVEGNCRHSKLKAQVSKAKEIKGNHHSVKKRPGKASRGVKAMAIGGNRSKNGVLFRAASQALFDSISLTSSSSKGRYLLNEAQATLQIGKLLGLNGEGNEKDVVEQIMELEK